MCCMLLQLHSWVEKRNLIYFELKMHALIISKNNLKNFLHWTIEEIHSNSGIKKLETKIIFFFIKIHKFI